MFRLVATLLGLAICESIYAVDATPSESDFFTDLPVVLSASRLPQAPSEVPGAMTVLDRDAIVASGAREIADLFRLVPGMLVGYSNGHFPTVTYHAFQDNYARMMQVLVDGRSIYTPYFVGGVDWSGLGLAVDDIERIEVFRGTNSVTYGANAALGVINIITRTGSDGPTAHLAAASGNQGVSDVITRLTATGDAGAMRMTYGIKHDTGFSDLHDGQRREFLNMRGDLTLSTDTAFTMHVGRAMGTFEEGFPGAVDDSPHLANTTSDFLQAKLLKRLDSAGEVVVHYYHNREAARERVIANFSPLLPPLEVNADRAATRDDLEATHLWQPEANTRIVWGTELRQDTMSSRMLFGTNARHTVNLFRLFGNLEWRLSEPWLLNAGVMREDYRLHDPTFSYRAFLNYRLDREQTLRGGVSTGYRNASVFEQRGNWAFSQSGLLLDQFYQASGRLEPEKVTSRELGYHGDLRGFAMTLDLRLYREDVDRLICRYERALPPGTELAPANTTYDFANCSGRHTKDGFELAWNWRPFATTRVTLNIATVHGSTSIQGPPEGIANTARDLYFPRYLASALIEQRLPMRAVLSAAWYKVAPPRFAGTIGPDYYGSVPADQQKGYQRVDLRLARDFRVATGNMQAALVVQNVGGSYEEFQPGVVFQRRSFATLTVDF
jgi:iron complex outermembrane receptor protein